MVIGFEYSPRGRMTVDLEQFLPTTQRRVRKLFRLMVPNISDDERKSIERYLEEKLEKCEQSRRVKQYQAYLKIFRKELR